MPRRRRGQPTSPFFVLEYGCLLDICSTKQIQIQRFLKKSAQGLLQAVQFGEQYSRGRDTRPALTRHLTQVCHLVSLAPLHTHSRVLSAVCKQSEVCLCASVCFHLRGWCMQNTTLSFTGQYGVVGLYKNQTGLP